MNKFDHIKSKPMGDPLLANLSRLGNMKEKPKHNSLSPSKVRLGRSVFDTLMGILSEDTETPTTPYGVLVANSTKRNIRKQIEAMFKP